MNPSSFPSALPATHPYHQRIAKEQRQNLPPPPPTVPPSTSPSTGPNTLGMVSIDKSKLLDICERHERMVADSTVAAFLSDLKKMLN